MIASLKNHKLALFITAALFFLVCQYYIAVDPVRLGSGDDWRYFGAFYSNPIPIIGTWNVTRLFPEYLMPLIGYQSAFFTYPLVGDYLIAAGISLAVTIAFFISALYISLYRLLVSLHENRYACALTGLFMIALCFAFFKQSPSGNVHMFFAEAYNLYFYYVFPNIFNSIIILILMRKMVLANHLSFSSPWLLVAIYFGIFSILFSAAILLSFAISVLLFRFFLLWRPEKKYIAKLKSYAADIVTHYNIALTIIVGVVAAMLLELTSGRAKADYLGDPYSTSLFSLGFLKRIGTSADNFSLLVRSTNKYVFAAILLIVLIAVVHCFMRRKTAPPLKNPLINLAIFSFLSAAVLACFHIMAAAKAGTHYSGEIRSVYGAFFFVVLAVGLLALYIQREMAPLRFFAPLALVLVLLVAANTRWPYHMVSRNSDKQLWHKLIPVLVEADEQMDTDIILYLPEHWQDKWVYDSFCDTLYNHKLILSKINIVEIRESTSDNPSYSAYAE